MTGPGLIGAAVRGYPAVVLVELLDRHGPDQMVRLQQSVDAGRLPASYLQDVARCWADIRTAAQWWASSVAVAAVGGTVSSLATAMPERLVADMFDTDQAADVLHVTPNRVRQLLRCGALSGRKVGRSWLVSSASVQRLKEL